MGGLIVILFVCFLGYTNSVRAKQKGKNGILWAALTIISYLFFEMVGMMFVILVFCKGEVDINALSQVTPATYKAVSDNFNNQVLKALEANPMRDVLVMGFAFGGFLLIRYLLDRKPNKKQPEIHWMDKMGSSDPEN